MKMFPYTIPNNTVLSKDALKSMSVKDSAEAVAIAFNVPRRDIYQLALQIKSGGD